MESSSSSVFVVLLGIGYAEDYTQKVLRTFTKKEDAEHYVARKNHSFDQLEGLYMALDRLLDQWAEKNPAPSYSSYDWTQQKADDHYEEKLAEERRLIKALRLEEECQRLGVLLHDKSFHCSYVESKLDGDMWED